MSADKVPMMFRAQVQGRCQLHYPAGDPPDAVMWVDEWTDKAYPQSPSFGDKVQFKRYKVSWRFVTNGGQDDGVIRPIIGSYGWPFYPGSSMKGVFRQACQELESMGEVPTGTCLKLCGDERDQSPGSLRFHGGYPTDQSWTDKLVDVVHPQQNWQVETQNTRSKKGSAYAQISLYQPELKFGLSLIKPSPVDWDVIWKIWEYGLTKGLGCRVCSGYGQFSQTSNRVLLTTHLKGQGPVSSAVGGTLEFRPNIFRAAIRGHALRIFGGLTTENNAQKIVEQLFGGIGRDSAQWGLLSMNFNQHQLDIHDISQTYRVTGELVWSLTRSLPDNELRALQNLIRRLVQFAMFFGGFGKSWRRSDHRLFMPSYDDHQIGCYWLWNSNPDLLEMNPVRKLEDIVPFINDIQQTAKDWMALQGIHLQPNLHANWREVWHPKTVQVWGRKAGIKESLTPAKDDCRAIYWLHEAYSYDYRNGKEVPLTIKGTSVVGSLKQIGRLWHRMYPIVVPRRDPEDSSRFIPKITAFSIELLTLFPDQNNDFEQFLDYLDSDRSGFQLVWGNMP